MKNLIITSIVLALNIIGTKGQAQKVVQEYLNCSGDACQTIASTSLKQRFAYLNLTFATMPPYHMASLTNANLVLNPVNCRISGTVSAYYNHSTYEFDFYGDFWNESIHTDGSIETSISTGQQSTLTSQCGVNYLPADAYVLAAGNGGYYYSNGLGQYCALGATSGSIPVLAVLQSIPSVNKYVGLCAGYAGDYLPLGSYVLPNKNTYFSDGVGHVCGGLPSNPESTAIPNIPIQNTYTGPCFSPANPE